MSFEKNQQAALEYVQKRLQHVNVAFIEASDLVNDPDCDISNKINASYHLRRLPYLDNGMCAELKLIPRNTGVWVQNFKVWKVWKL